MKFSKGLALSRVEGFTLVELTIVIVITVILSGVILMSVTQYVSKGKDANVAAELVVLVPAGEVFYNGNGNSYNDTVIHTPGASFCNPDNDSTLKNSITQMPQSVTKADCYSDTIIPSAVSSTNPAGVCCYAASDGNSWAACAQEFAKPDSAYCVDSRGVKKEISNDTCQNLGNNLNVNITCD